MRFEAARPEVALAGVQALLEAYESMTREANDSHERLQYARAQERMLRKAAEELGTRLAQLQGDNRETGQGRTEIERMEGEKADLEREAEQMRALADQLESQLRNSNPVKIESRGFLPTTPFRDPRQWSAALGLAVGAHLGLLVAFLLGRRRDAAAPRAR